MFWHYHKVILHSTRWSIGPSLVYIKHLRDVVLIHILDQLSPNFHILAILSMSLFYFFLNAKKYAYKIYKPYTKEVHLQRTLETKIQMQSSGMHKLQTRKIALTNNDKNHQHVSPNSHSKPLQTSTLFAVPIPTIPQTLTAFHPIKYISNGPPASQLWAP